MAYDFPLAPTVGQVYEDPTSGAAYIWNGWAWDLVAGGDLTDYVLKAGDTMTGELVINGAGVSFPAGNVAATANDHSKHLHLWDSGVNGGFGINITSGRMNYNVEASGNSHWFRVANVDKVKIDNGGLQSQGHVESLSSGLYATGCNVHARSGGVFSFRTDDNNAWRNALNCGQAHIQYMQGGNNDGAFRIWTANGGYTDNWVLQTTIVNGLPGINVNGKVNTGSGDSYGVMIGDRWHGWTWSNTANQEHLRSYQGSFQFLKCANTADGAGEALALINTAGVSTQSVSGSSFIDRSLIDRPELAEFVEGEDDVPLPTDMVIHIPRRGINLGRLLLRALDRIDALEAEVKTLKGRKK